MKKKTSAGKRRPSLSGIRQQIPEDMPRHIVIQGAVCVLLAAAFLISLLLPQRPVQGAFIPPAFDPAAISGKPQVPEPLVYKELYQDGMHFSAWICVTPVRLEGEVLVYFTNPASNSVWMKLRVLNEAGDTVGESGLLRPGEYVRSVTLVKDVSPGDAVNLKVMTYEPDTYFSMGSVGVNTTIAG